MKVDLEKEVALGLSSIDIFLIAIAFMIFAHIFNLYYLISLEVAKEWLMPKEPPIVIEELLTN